MTTPLTPEHIAEAKGWYNALRSGNYRQCQDTLQDASGALCAVGVYYQSSNCFDRLCLLRDTDLAAPIIVGNDKLGWTFTDCANYLHNYFLETHAVDLDDWPESAVAPKVAPKAAAQ